MREFRGTRKRSEEKGEDLEAFPLNLDASPSRLEFSHSRVFVTCRYGLFRPQRRIGIRARGAQCRNGARGNRDERQRGGDRNEHRCEAEQDYRVPGGPAGVHGD